MSFITIDQRISQLLARTQNLISQLSALNTVALDLRKQVEDLEPVLRSSTKAKQVAFYGYCPTCSALGVIRERRWNGNDRCSNGHTYPSSTATSSPLPDLRSMDDFDVPDPAA